MITEDYVSFETAKLLKKKGFDEPTTKSYYTEGFENPMIFSHDLLPCIQTDEFLCPTLQMTMKWLREVHNYDISICLDSYVEPYDNEYYIVIRRRKDQFEEISPCEQVYFKTYEEACEAAINYCLNNLI